MKHCNNDVSVMLGVSKGLGFRISAALDKMGSRTDAAKMLDKSVDMLSRYVKEESEPPFSFICKLAQAAQISVAWLATEDGQMQAENQSNNSVAITEIGTKSVWIFPAEYILELHITQEDLRIIQINGDSMMPTLQSGERAFINCGDKNPSPSGLFALWDGFGNVVKRIERVMDKTEETFRIISDNSAYSSYEINAKDANIIGRVICCVKRV